MSCTAAQSDHWLIVLLNFPAKARIEQKTLLENSHH